MTNILSMVKDEKISGLQEEIVLTGRPESLRGKLHLTNNGDEVLYLNELQLNHNKKQAPEFPDALKVNVAVWPGKRNIAGIKYALPANTPPGEYHTEVIIGGVTKRLKLIVEKSENIKLTPSRVWLENAAPGKEYKIVVLISNQGNTAIKLPGNFKHSVMLDDNYICKTLSLAIVQKGGQGFTAFMDGVVNHIHSNMAKQMTVDVAEKGAIIEPGASKNVHITFTLPKDYDTAANYAGNLRIAGTKEISYHVTA